MVKILQTSHRSKVDHENTIKTCFCHFVTRGCWFGVAARCRLGGFRVRFGRCRNSLRFLTHQKWTTRTPLKHVSVILWPGVLIWGGVGSYLIIYAYMYVCICMYICILVLLWILDVVFTVGNFSLVFVDNWIFSINSASQKIIIFIWFVAQFLTQTPIEVSKNLNFHCNSC